THNQLHRGGRSCGCCSAGPPWRAVPTEFLRRRRAVTMAKGTHRQWPLEGGWRHIVAFVLAVLAIAPRVWAAPGDLDPSFRGTGVALTVIRGTPSAVVRQDDGKLVVAGSSWGRHPLHHPPVFTLVRYRPDGTRDTRFGSSGIVTTGRGKGAAAAGAVIQQADGKLVAAGFRSLRGNGYYGDHSAFALVRYDARGRLDKSFG